MTWLHRMLAVAGAIALAATLPVAASAQAAGPRDELKVVMCGTSGPLPIRDRAKPCVAVQAGGAMYLVDIGPEASKNLMLWRMPLATAHAVFITHLHSDHIGDLGEFNNNSWEAGRPGPLIVVGPPGVDKLVEGMNEAYGPDHGFRHVHHEHGDVKLTIDAGLMTAKVAVLPAQADADGVRSAVVWTEGALKVTAILVQHNPASPAYAYRFDYKGRSVVVSGDTIKWPPLAAASRGADVLIHEAQNPQMTQMLSTALKSMGNARMSSMIEDTLSYHASPVEAAEIAKAAGVKALVFYHLTQAGLPMFTPEAFTRGVDAVGFPDWRLSKDGMTIELPVGSSDILWGQL
jgi:ribonuclease Z